MFGEMKFNEHRYTLHNSKIYAFFNDKVLWYTFPFKGQIGAKLGTLCKEFNQLRSDYTPLIR